MRDLKTNLNLLIEAAEKTRELADSADKICAALANCIRGGGTIFTCGNGGRRNALCRGAYREIQGSPPPA